MDYKTSGVDIEAGYKSVELMKKHIAKTMRPEVLGGIGGFSGAFSMEKFKDNHRKAFYGKCLVVVQNNGEHGDIELTATAEGLKAAVTKIEAR